MLVRGKKSISRQMDKYHNSISSWWVFMLLIVTLDTISLGSVEGLQVLDKNSFGPKPKGTIKTIEVLEDGDIIDCVDIYKQPALDNLLIKELKMKPSSYPKAFNKTNDRQPRLIQTWNKYGECLKGTIPIIRTWNNNGTTHPETINDKNIHEYATVVHEANNCQGGKARLNIWEPRAGPNEFSLSQIWVVSGQAAEKNTIEVGWQVYPDMYGNIRTRFFTYYTPDNYRTKCYNLECDGFVQLDKFIVLGGPFASISVYNGEQIDILVSISRDRNDGNWWLLVNDKVVGYFRGEKFTTLRHGADSVAFGGEIVNQNRRGHHTLTRMGSGHFSGQGYRRACYISNIQVVNDVYEWVEPNLRLQAITRPECYDLISGPLLTTMGSHFYFGGPGYSQQCR